MVAKVETERRGVTLEDMFAFAVALGVPPTSLVLPRTLDAEIAVTPKVAADPALIHAWFRGDNPRLTRGQRVDDQQRRHYSEAAPDLVWQADRRVPYLRSVQREAAEGILWASGVLKPTPSMLEDGKTARDMTESALSSISGLAHAGIALLHEIYGEGDFPNDEEV